MNLSRDLLSLDVLIVVKIKNGIISCVICRRHLSNLKTSMGRFAHKADTLPLSYWELWCLFTDHTIVFKVNSMLSSIE